MWNIGIQEKIASASSVLSGRYGDVTELAHRRGVSRQTIYRQADRVCCAVEGTQAKTRAQLLEEKLAESEAYVSVLQQMLRRAVVIDADKQAEFASVAQAIGVSLSAAQTLLGVFLKSAVPSVSKLGRGTLAAGRKAASLLAVLDEYSRPKARQTAADELFAGRQPVLMTIEQESMCWLGARLAASRDGPEWAKEFGQLPAVEQVTRDGGSGMRKGLAAVNRQRREKHQSEIGDQEDHFHIFHRGQRAMRQVRHQAVKAFDKAAKAQHVADRSRHRGLRTSGVQARVACHWWRKAEASWDRWTAQERAWQRLQSGMRLFTPEGELNTRVRAEAEVRAALAELTGPEWARLRRRLVGPGAFTFLDRVHNQLAALPMAEKVRDLLVRREGLRRRPEMLRGEGAQAAASRGLLLVAGVTVALLGQAGTLATRAVQEILRQAWRASSLVEGLNSVLRMQQARQKRMTQGLLDLKRLHWNAHVFRAGRRKGQSPYSKLGVILPDGGWWQLLKMTPEQLRHKLSHPRKAA
jgi:hypothetical protein